MSLNSLLNVPTYSYEDQLAMARTVYEFFQENPSHPHTEGFSYIALFGDGTVKIGYTTQLRRRLRVLSNLNDGRKVYPLAIVLGGKSMEQVLHWQFRESRIGYLGERFLASADILEFSLKAGISIYAESEYKKYLEYEPKKK